MKIFTSYFYQVRFFKPYQIPVSTAIWDPKWFHDFKDQKHKFIDKNGVINGIRAESLHPDNSCHGLCSGKPCIHQPETCDFLKAYRKQIFSLDKKSIIDKFKKIGDLIQYQLRFVEEPEIVLLVHETLANDCSERKTLQDFFNCTEFKREIRHD